MEPMTMTPTADNLLVWLHGRPEQAAALAAELQKTATAAYHEVTPVAHRLPDVLLVRWIHAPAPSDPRVEARRVQTPDALHLILYATREPDLLTSVKVWIAREVHRMAEDAVSCMSEIPHDDAVGLVWSEPRVRVDVRQPKIVVSLYALIVQLTPVPPRGV